MMSGDCSSSAQKRKRDLSPGEETGKHSLSTSCPPEDGGTTSATGSNADPNGSQQQSGGSSVLSTRQEFSGNAAQASVPAAGRSPIRSITSDVLDFDLSHLAARLNNIVGQGSEFSFAFVFSTESFSAEYRSAVAPPWLKALLPSKVLGLHATGIVATDDSTGSTKEITDYKVKGQYIPAPEVMSLLLLPKFNGMQIKHFTFNEESATTVRGPMSDEYFQSLTGIARKERVACVLLFGSEEGTSQRLSAVLAAKFYQRQGGNVAVGGATMLGGGLLDLNGDGVGGRSVSHGVAFCGESVRAVSVTFERKIDTPKQAAKLFESLRKKCAIPERNSFAFMFSCRGRWERTYKGKTNVESSAFRKCFPTVPLVGLFAGSEIGCTSLCNMRSGADLGVTVIGSASQLVTTGVPKPPTLIDRVLHQFTTTIVVVSVIE